MGREKEWKEEIDNILGHLIHAGVISECSIHPGCTFLSGDENSAYAVATNLFKEGVFSGHREIVMSAVKEILAEIPDDCAGCSAG